MARKLKNETTEPAPAQPGHNAQARKKIIRDACRELVRLEAQRKEISEKISELKNTKIKGDLGMKIADFAMAYRLYQLEGEDRDKLFDTLRETFSALGVGAQLDFLTAMQEEPASEEAAEIIGDPDKMDSAGYRVGKAGGSSTSCPVNPEHRHYRNWMDGWERAQAEIAGRMKLYGEGATAL